MSFELPLPNTYDLKARLVPAVIATAPALALAVLLVSWNSLGMSDVVIGLATMALLIVFSDLARRYGKRVEPGIFEELGGKPSTTLLRHRDQTFDALTKGRYRTYLATRIGEMPPTAVDEESTPAATDALYERCIQWLIAKTRDTKKYRVLFIENVTYGFRRNIYGLRWFGFLVNAVTVFVCLMYFYIGDIFGFGPELRKTAFGIIVFAVIHALYLFFYTTRSSVIEASKEYGRRLILSCETVMEEEPLVAGKPKKK